MVKRLVIVLLTAALAVLVLVAPLPELGPPGRICLVLFVVVAAFWMTEVVPLYVTSFMLLAAELIVLVPALQSAGLPGTKTDFLAPFFSDIIMLFLGGLLLAVAGTKYRIDRWFASAVLAVVGGRPTFALFGLMLAGALLSMWMSNTATTAMMLIVALALVRDLPPDAGGFRKALFVGIPFACNLGGMGTPVGTPPNAIALAHLAEHGVAVSFLDWMVLAVPLVLVLLLVLWGILVALFPLPRERLPLAERGDFPSGSRPRAVLALFCLTVVLWLTGDLHGLKSGEVALLACIGLLASGLLDAADFRSVQWDVLFLVGGGLSLGVAMERSGLGSWTIAVLQLDGLGLPALIVALVLLAMLLTTFMSNTATAGVLIPLAVALPVGRGPIVVAIALSVSASMSLPVSTPPNAIGYASGEIDLRDMLRAGLLVSLVSGLLITACALFVWGRYGLAP